MTAGYRSTPALAFISCVSSSVSHLWQAACLGWWNRKAGREGSYYWTPNGWFPSPTNIEPLHRGSSLLDSLGWRVLMLTHTRQSNVSGRSRANPSCFCPRTVMFFQQFCDSLLWMRVAAYIVGFQSRGNVFWTMNLPCCISCRNSIPGQWMIYRALIDTEMTV